MLHKLVAHADKSQRDSDKVVRDHTHIGVETCMYVCVRAALLVQFGDLHKNFLSYRPTAKYHALRTSTSR